MSARDLFWFWVLGFLSNAGPIFFPNEHVKKNGQSREKDKRRGTSGDGRVGMLADAIPHPTW